MRPIIFGEVLFDRFPDGTVVLGGAPFNVAWNLQAFGLNPLMISRIGSDELGRKVEEAMARWGMDCVGLQIDAHHATGSVQVAFDAGEPSYDIVDKVAYDFIDASEIPPLHDQEWLLYHGSLAVRHACSMAALEEVKDACTGSLMVDINLRSPWWNRDSILKLIRGTDWIKLNEDELGALYPDGCGRAERLQMLSNEISELIVLTSGAKGATAMSITDEKSLSVAPETASAVTDTVGAGDAFCSILMAGRLLGWPLDVSMQRAQAFASGVVGLRGATTEDEQFYARFSHEWHLRE